MECGLKQRKCLSRPHIQWRVYHLQFEGLCGGQQFVVTVALSILLLDLWR